MHYAIIAAGEGSRLKHEGINVPKPLVRIGGSTLIERLTGIFRSRHDCESVSVVISPEVAACAPEIDADHVVTASTPGSMHSLHRLAPCLKGCGRFCLTTVDTVFDPTEFDHYIDAYATDTGTYDGYMGVTTYIDDEKPLYVDADPSTDMITAFRDAPTGTDRYISGGIYGLPPKAIDVLAGCMEQGISRMRNYQRALLESGLRLKAYPFDKIVDVDHAADIRTAREFIAS